VIRRGWVAAIALWLSVGFIGIRPPVYAEFGVGVGDVREPSLKASARFNEALSSFHLMLAALDRNNKDDVTKYQSEATRAFKEAADLYGQTSSKADMHILKPTPQTQQEKEDVDYFFQHSKGYDIREPISQKELLATISRQVSKLGASISEPRKFENLHQQQAIANSAAELQRFLNSATTMLTIG
jgi:hypothetical protein